MDKNTRNYLTTRDIVKEIVGCVALGAGIGLWIVLIGKAVPL